jgi:hypothetical protein
LSSSGWRVIASRSSSTVADGLVQLDSVLDVGGGLAQLSNLLPIPGRQLGELLRPQEHERDDQDDDDFGHPEVEHDPNI